LGIKHFKSRLIHCFVASVGIVGLGPMGQAIVHYLVNNTKYVINGYDVSEDAVERARRVGINAVRVDVRDSDTLRLIARDNDLVISAVPQSIADQVVLGVHDYGKPIIDLIFMWKYDEALASKLVGGPIVVPACGWAPGLTNVLAMAAASELEEVEEVGIHVGGNPTNPKPPLYYELLFSLESTIDEYVRPATIIRDGRVVNVDPLSEIFSFSTWLVNGDFAEFYTDGLSTLLITLPKHFKALRNAYERTIRWRRHLEIMKTLKDLGLLNSIEDAKHVLSRVLEKGSNDFSITVVEARGRIDGEVAVVRFEGVDYAQGGFTSMARLTGFTAAIIADLVLRGRIEGKGLLPIEEAYSANKDILKEILRGLRSQGIRFWFTKTVIGG